MLYGSAPMAPEWIAKTIEAFPGVEVCQGYGLTETSPILTYLDFDEHKKALAANDYTRLKAAGRPIVGVDMRILDDQGREAPLGEPTSSGMLTLHCPPQHVHALATLLRDKGAENVVVGDLGYVFSRANPLYARLEAALA